MSELYKIEHGIPLDSSTRFRRKYPFREMSVGDSFEVPLPEGNGCRTVAYTFAERQTPSWKFETRLNDDRTAVRIWRTK